MNLSYSDLKLLVVLVHLGQFVCGLPLQCVQLVLQSPTVHTFLRHRPSEGGQSSRCKVKTGAQKGGSVSCARPYNRFLHLHETLLVLMFRSFSVSLCCSGTSCESFFCQSCSKESKLGMNDSSMVGTEDQKRKIDHSTSLEVELQSVDL